MFTILGLRLIPNIDGGEVDPTPTAAPVERIIGALGAEYLKPINIIKLIDLHVGQYKHLLYYILELIA